MASPYTELPELGSDADDDEALRYAIALSLQESNRSTNEAATATQPSPRKSEGGQAMYGNIPLNRKQMEEERLQRLAKRRRASSSDDVVEVPPPKRPALPSASLSATAVPFRDGVVKRTWVQGHPRTADDIKIDELWQRDQLLLAVLSSFQWDEEWIMSKVDLRNTNLLLLAFAADDAQKESMRANVPPGIKFCFPPMNGPGSMHSKLQLLKYPSYLRVVVPTGNLVPHDWGESGVMENMVFAIDLPRLKNSKEHRPTNFSTDLGQFLTAAGVDDRMVSSLSNYDFSRTAQLGFVCSIPGGHTDDSLKRIGYCGLGASVAALGLTTTEPIDVDLACASLGSIKYDLIHAIYNACQGDDGLKEYHARTGRKPSANPAGTLNSLKERFRIYFPTDRTVRSSRGSAPAGGTICLQEKWWRSPSFPRELVRDCVNTRDGLLMHSKIILVRRARRVPANERQSPGWAYVGSANLSESAWGRLVKDRTSGKPKMSCRNWECGVVIPIPAPSAKRNAVKDDGGNDNDDGSIINMTVFSGVVPVPMQVPGPIYEAEDQPWFFLNA